MNGHTCTLKYVEFLRYLGVYFVRSRQLKCNYDNANLFFIVKFLRKKLADIARGNHLTTNKLQVRALSIIRSRSLFNQ